MTQIPEEQVLAAIQGGTETVEGISRATKLHPNTVRAAVRGLLRAKKIQDGRAPGDWAVPWFVATKQASVHLAAKALPPEKLQELYLKIRKGATSSITMSQLDAILEALGGGKILPIVGFDFDPDPKRGRTGPAIYPIHSRDDGQTVESALERLKPYIRPIPSKPKVGEVYITSAKAEVSNGMPAVAYEAALAVAGIRVTAPDGQVKEFLSRSPIGRLPIPEIVRGYPLPPATKAPPTYDPLGWLVKDTDFIKRVNAALGTEEHKPAEARSRDGTGTCPVCFANVKIKPQGSTFAIVLHGYKRPGHGRTEGKCFGVKYPPFELSPEGTKVYLAHFVAPKRKQAEEYLTKLQSGQVTEISQQGTWGKPVVIKPDSPSWERTLKSEIGYAQKEIEWFKREEDDLGRLVARWKEIPLPKEGDSLFAVRFASVKVSAERVASRILDR